MASSNRHWPSMFKSKHCSNHHHHHQWQHALAGNSSSASSLLPNGCHRPGYGSGLGREERTPEPKPRWNPKPEQIRILESIFNSGMVNPPREEIRNIRIQLQAFGQVGDANVFYWFQNRKSRSKHKHRQGQAQGPSRRGGGGAAGSNNSNASNNSSSNTLSGVVDSPSCVSISVAGTPTAATAAVPTNSSSSSDRSTNSGASDRTAFGLGVGLNPGTALLDAAGNANIASMVGHGGYLHHGDQSLPSGGGASEAFSFLQQLQMHQGYALPNDDMLAFLGSIPDPSLELYPGLRAEFGQQQQQQYNHHQPQGCVESSRDVDALQTVDNKMQLHLQQNDVYGTPTAAESTAVTTAAIVTTAAAGESQITEIHAQNPALGSGSSGSSGCSGTAGGAPASVPPRLVVFINQAAYEVSEPGHINVKETFGDLAVLFDATGQPVLVNEWGVTMQPLQHGASYYTMSLYNAINHS